MRDRSSQHALILDDDVATAHLQRRCLERAGFRITCAHDVHVAMAAMQEATFDVLVLDYNLTGYTGFDFLEMMAHAGLSVPVVMVSGWDDKTLATRARDAGVQKFVHKSGDYLAELPRAALEAQKALAGHGGDCDNGGDYAR